MITKHNSRKQAGLSLIELMISLTIGLVLLLGITSLIVQQSQTRDELAKSSRQIDNGRYAIQLMHDDIEHAGFFGKYADLTAASGVLPDPCSTSATTMESALLLPVQGYNNILPTATFSCKLDGVNTTANADNYMAGTDILVIRRADTVTTPLASVFPGVYYIQTNHANHVIGTGSDTSVFTLFNATTSNTAAADVRALITRIYFISPCSVPAGGGTSCTGSNDDNGRPIPTLKRLDLTSAGGAPAFAMTRLVEGIENMQIDYGIDSNNDGYPDNNYTTVPSNSAEWSNVMTIRVNLLARNTECTTNYTDVKTYNLGTAGNITPSGSCINGGYKRHVFTELIRAINPSGRRAQE